MRARRVVREPLAERWPGARVVDARLWVTLGRSLHLLACYCNEVDIPSHAKLFRFWRGEVKTRPQRLPSPLVSDALSEVNLAAAGERWNIRVARVHSPGEDWVSLDEEGRATAEDPSA